MPEELLGIMARERIPQLHDEALVCRVAELRCSRASGPWPCDDCVRDVASVIRDIERAGLRLIDGPEFEETNGLLGPSNASKLVRHIDGSGEAS